MRRRQRDADGNYERRHGYVYDPVAVEPERDEQLDGYQRRNRCNVYPLYDDSWHEILPSNL